MRVFRIERPGGLGPYMNNSTTEPGWALHRKHGCSENHPSVREDVPTFVSDSDYFCGFSSLEQLNRWFEDSFDILEEMECELVEYNTKEVMLGSKQLVFRKPAATRVRSVKIKVKRGD